MQQETPVFQSATVRWWERIPDPQHFPSVSYKGPAFLQAESEEAPTKVHCSSTSKGSFAKALLVRRLHLHLAEKALPSGRGVLSPPKDLLLQPAPARAPASPRAPAADVEEEASQARFVPAFMRRLTFSWLTFSLLFIAIFLHIF